MPSHLTFTRGGPPPLETSTLSRARRGDASALNALVGRYLPWLHRVAHGRLPRWVRTVADTADVVQDAMMRTIARLRIVDLPDAGAFAAYLTEAVRNRIRDEHRRFASHGTRCLASDALPDAAPSPVDRAIAGELEARYRGALARLAPADQYLVVGHVELDYSHDQLGHMTGRSRNAARMALQRALRRLAAQMQH